jgi:hypothetical protein
MGAVASTVTSSVMSSEIAGLSGRRPRRRSFERISLTVRSSSAVSALPCWRFAWSAWSVSRSICCSFAVSGRSSPTTFARTPVPERYTSVGLFRYCPATTTWNVVPRQPPAGKT